MILLIVFEILVVSIFSWMLITQVSIPVFRGTVLFPMFRKEEKLKNKLANINQEILEKNIEEKIKKIKNKK